MNDKKSENNEHPKLVTIKIDGRPGFMCAEAGDFNFKKGDYCVCSENGSEFVAQVVQEPRRVEFRCYSVPLRRIKRPATKNDIESSQRIKSKETEAFAFCLEKVKERDLKMKLVKVKEDQDERKIIFYYTAEARVDFRELVKDLAARLRSRIEMRQIGVRDEAKLISGCGICGRAFCCSSFLSSFEPISIRMAKEQNINLNPAKISGICGRLMCCLSYEVDEQTKRAANNNGRNGANNMGSSPQAEADDAAVEKKK